MVIQHHPNPKVAQNYRIPKIWHGELESDTFRKKLNEHMHSHLACKSAVKAGDTLDTEMMTGLVRDLLAADKRFICVHGRPTMWHLSRDEIAKKFRRPS